MNESLKTSLNILMVEDNRADKRLIEELLNEIPDMLCHIFWVTRVSEAASRLQRDVPDVILLDLSLPDTDGLETFEEIHGIAASVPVIILSGLSDEAMAVEAVRRGAQDYLVKGKVDRHLLSRSIRYAVERKQIETSLKQANDQLKEIDRLKSTFLSSVSHELRTPMAMVKEGVALCLDGLAGPVTEKQREVLTTTQQNIERLSRLISDLLDLSRIQSGRIELNRMDMDLTEVIRDACRSFEARIRERELALSLDLPDSPVEIQADPEKISQIFHNLLDNAVRFGRPGGTIRVGVTDRNGCVECLVGDNGIGIPEKEMYRLFSKFEQIGRKDGPGYNGTGMGLAIVKGLVERHGGDIRAESHPDKGTTFHFTLKRESHPLILIVDDSPNIVEIVKKFLGTDAYEFAEAYDGPEALDKAAREIPALIVLDLMLPGMSGYEVIEKLKAQELTKDIPVLILSASCMDGESAQTTGGKHAIPIMGKPIRPEELRHTVKQLIRH